jgi:hypothetical protein
MKRFAFVLMVLSPSLVACGGDQDPILAEVGPRQITVSDFNSSYISMKPEERPPMATPEDKAKFLEDLINKEVMELAAFERYPELEERQQWRLKRYRDKTLTDYVRTYLVRDQSAPTQEMKDRLHANMKRERKLEAMLIPDHDAAQYVRKQLDQGADFGALARDHSIKWVSDVMHGNMGWTQPGEFPYHVDMEVWDAEIGGIVGPARTGLGSYIVRILDERPAQAPASRQEMDGILHEKLLEPLYLSRLKGVQDSLRAAADPYVSAEAKALLTMKYYFEMPEEMADNPTWYLDAQRVLPTFTAEEAAMVIVDFKDGEDWTASEFAERLSWYPSGLWPRGQDDSQLEECLDMMLRDYLYIKAAEDLGFVNEDFDRKLDSMAREMRVTFFYFNDLKPQFEPTQAEIDSFFQANREGYRAPKAYKIAFFGGRNKEVIESLAEEWKQGASYLDLREKYEPRDPEMLVVGESEWLYEGQDVVRDDIVATLKEGGVCDPVTRTDVSMVFKLIARRPSRLFSYGEIKPQVDEQAEQLIGDNKLATYLRGRREDFPVTIHEKELQKLKAPETSDQASVAEAG